MSSLRNSNPRRPHRERAQPSTRQKWGLLEKHKDYSLRAQDYNAKKRKLDILAQKTRERHPDEFAFGMVNRAQGRFGARGDPDGNANGKDTKGNENRLSHEAVQLLKTQDAGYLRNAAQRTRREVQKVEEERGMGRGIRRADAVNQGLAVGKGKIVFADDGEDTQTTNGRGDLDHENESGSDTEDLHASFHTANGDTNMPDHETLGNTANPSTPPTKILSKKHLQKQKDKLVQLKADRKRRKRLQDLRDAKLEVLKKRQRDIMAAADALDLQRSKMAKTVGGANKSGIKFKVRERKK